MAVEAVQAGKKRTATEAELELQEQQKVSKTTTEQEIPKDLKECVEKEQAVESEASSKKVEEAAEETPVKQSSKAASEVADEEEDEDEYESEEDESFVLEEDEDLSDEEDSDFEVAEEELMALQESMTFAAQLREVLTADGPVVKCVYLEVGKEPREGEIDMTPRLNCVGKYLGRSPSFVGSICDDVVVIMGFETPEDVPLNEHVLPGLSLGEDEVLPNEDGQVLTKDDLTVRGNLILLRVDADANPQDFTLIEYQEALKKLSD